MTVSEISDRPTFRPELSNCRFCAIEERESPLLNTPDMMVFPSVGSLVEGWLLIAPKRHVITLSELTGAERTSFQDVVDRVGQIVGAKYGKFVTFEHGPATAGRSAGCGVDHAHLHVVPTVANLVGGARAIHPVGARLTWKQAVWPWDARQDHESGMDYLYLCDQNGVGSIAAAPEIPSQLFRRVIAGHLGHDKWDWNADPRMSTYEDTADRLRTEFI
ncbi:HIT family protein [Actinoplanes sp. NPDC048791]|uniref:HIT family protein n=1 Tax=Actinoplanes sp. NPDC048791 TaxID=3154623 RepID=UPI0033CFA0BF